MLDRLTEKGYIRLEHPKNMFVVNGNKIRLRDKTKPKGYNIVAGKLSFPIAKVLDLDSVAPTLVATEIGKLVVPTKTGVRRLTVREGFRICGYPEDYRFENVSYTQVYDLLGNTVIPHIAEKLTEQCLVN